MTESLKPLLTVDELKARTSHPDWPEYLNDISRHWGMLIEIG